MLRKYTVEEIRKHNHANDLWIVLRNEVYNLTKFLKEHPGGEEVLINLAGTDGTICFDNVGHSEEAKSLKVTYKIGEVDRSLPENMKLDNINSIKKEPEIIDHNWTYEESKNETTPLFSIFVGAAVLIYAIIFYFLFN